MTKMPNIDGRILLFNCLHFDGKADINSASTACKIAMGKKIFEYAECRPDLMDDFIYDICLLDHGFKANSLTRKFETGLISLNTITPSWRWIKFLKWREEKSYRDGVFTKQQPQAAGKGPK